MKLYLIYDPADIEKNKEYIALYERECAARGMGFELLANDESLCKKGFVPSSVVMNRSRDAALSAQLEALGLCVCNNSTVARLGNDKAAAQDYMEELGIPMMKRLSVPGDKDFPLVMKSVDGHGGSEVFMVRNSSDISAVQAKHPSRRFIFQEACDSPGRDKRVYIVGNRIVAVMLRENTIDFRSNYSLGGKACPSTLDAEEQDIVDNILSVLSMDMAGIDLIYHRGKPVFNELEDVVGSRMLYRYTDIDIVAAFFRLVIDQSAS